MGREWRVRHEAGREGGNTTSLALTAAGSATGGRPHTQCCPTLVKLRTILRRSMMIDHDKDRIVFYEYERQAEARCMACMSHQHPKITLSFRGNHIVSLDGRQTPNHFPMRPRSLSREPSSNWPMKPRATIQGSLEIMLVDDILAGHR